MIILESGFHHELGETLVVTWFMIIGGDLTCDYPKCSIINIDCPHILETTTCTTYSSIELFGEIQNLQTLIYPFS
jgi:hypothetical protein